MKGLKKRLTKDDSLTLFAGLELVAGAGAVWEENTIELEAGGAAEHSEPKA